jgi:hypothetical protein
MGRLEVPGRNDDGELKIIFLSADNCALRKIMEGYGGVLRHFSGIKVFRTRKK